MLNDLIKTIKMLIEQLPKELQEKARIELNEVPNEIETNLEHIRSWLKKQPYSEIARTDDLWLVNFLRGCKFSLQKTKEKLDTFHKVRYTYPSLYNNRDPLSDDVQHLLSSGLFLPIEGKNNVSIIVNWKNADPKNIPLELTLKVGYMLLEIFINEHSYCMVSGFHVIIDYTNFNLGYLPQVSLDLLKKIISTLQGAYPLRLRGIHLINVPQYIEVFLNLAKPLLQKHILKLSVYRVNNSEHIFDFIPKEMVPREFGGEGLDINTITEKYKAKVESYRDWFLKDEKRFSNTKIRSTKEKNSQNVSESFRKLNID